jgi:hypothetical protein
MSPNVLDTESRPGNTRCGPRRRFPFASEIAEFLPEKSKQQNPKITDRFYHLQQLSVNSLAPTSVYDLLLEELSFFHLKRS